MKVYCEEKNYKLYEGKMEDVLPTLDENSVDCIITDPPYELNFMNKGWDNSGVAFQKTTWEHCLRALKPGGYLLAFGGSRTFHRIACAIEDAGFEIRDTLFYLYGSGFPKSHNVGLSVDKKLGCPDRGHRVATASRFHPDGTFEPNGESLPPYESKTAEGKKWQGYGTALKPAYEPIIMARKPFKGSVADNILKYNVGGINIDECRVGNTSNDIYDLEKRQISKATGSDNDGHFLDLLHNKDLKHGVTEIGRFPANILHDGSDGVEDIFPESEQRYFYCAKANKKDRDEGLDEFENHKGGSYNFREDGSLDGNIPTRKNIHPTVKPMELMQYLIRLVAPKGATILDPFNGSGSTGKAAMFENRERQANYYYIGVEMTEEYLPISQARIDYALNKYIYDEKKEKEEREKNGITNIFDFL